MNFLLALFIISSAFATGPDDTRVEMLFNIKRVETFDLRKLACDTWTQWDESQVTSARLTLHRGKFHETVTLSGHADCLRGEAVKAHVTLMGYYETPIDPYTGQPTGQPSYHSCVMIAEFENGMRLSEWYRVPKDLSSCK